MHGEIREQRNRFAQQRQRNDFAFLRGGRNPKQAKSDHIAIVRTLPLGKVTFSQTR